MPMRRGRSRIQSMDLTRTLFGSESVMGRMGITEGMSDMQARDQEIPAPAQHGSTIEALARETGSAPAHVKELYECELAHLESNAKVRGFLSVLALRNVRMVLRDAYPATN
jgi:hypothetical protein